MVLFFISLIKNLRNFYRNSCTASWRFDPLAEILRNEFNNQGDDS